MKAAVYYHTGDPSVFRYEEVPDPVCRPGGVIIDVKAIGIQGGDTLHRQGGEMTGVPHIVGYQAAGVIREVGGNVTGRYPGQRVVATMPSGSHASLVSVPEAATYEVPEGLSLELAAGVPIEFGTADDCLFEFGHLKAGETVLVQAGGGGVGLAAVQLAKRAGATVLATASSQEKLDRLREFGVDHGINYKAENFVARAMQLTKGRGVDLVVDSVGGKTLEGSISALGYRGRVSWVGNAGREEHVADARALMQKNASLTGVFFGAELQAQPQRCRAMIERLLGDVARGQLKVVVDRKFALSDAAEAHRYIEGRSAFGRVLLVPN
ncbi:MAG: NADP-dependent oxidoreductase [Anaerolinea sp.]|nr:NADP-dependent oxidoreductase [Anaerolinea sp.]